jgi:hypothetical protein
MANESDPLLTFRIALDSPNEYAAQDIAERIAKLGLVATNVTARGLLVSGKKSTIERVLHASIDLSGKTAHFVVTPVIGGLDSSVTFRAYFPTAPTYF